LETTLPGGESIAGIDETKVNMTYKKRDYESKAKLFQGHQGKTLTDPE